MENKNKNKKVEVEKSHIENCFVSFESNEDIKKKNDLKRDSIDRANNAMRGNYHPKDSELTVVYGPDNNNNIF